uniref:Photosystem II Psb31 protein domain-containing protein n=2 Tax=Pseudo-nitzschia australis TaxID=44445 RepID=A0A7S4A9M9_9STRA
MKFVAVLSAALIASASAFAPTATSERAATALNMDRRAAMAGIAATAGAAAMPGLALADGAVSTATMQRQKFRYGSRIAALKDAVASGDFVAVAAEKNAFILYNSGAYPGSKNKAQKAEAIKATNNLFKSIRDKDAGALKSAYADYAKVVNLSDYAAISAEQGQGYSSDYDYRVGTKQAAIWVR